MFGFSKTQALLAPCDGEVIKTQDVGDEVFSEDILGKGFAVKPENKIIFAPISGTICEVSETRHAYCIETKDGLQVLIHIGIDTVKLKGEGFLSKIKKGDKVLAAQAVAEVDFELIKSKGLDTAVIVLITNPERISSPKTICGAAEGGRDVAFKYKLCKEKE